VDAGSPASGLGLVTMLAGAVVLSRRTRRRR
jgi:MYXO-CTERM domain-containing protein